MLGGRRLPRRLPFGCIEEAAQGTVANCSAAAGLLQAVVDGILKDTLEPACSSKRRLGPMKLQR